MASLKHPQKKVPHHIKPLSDASEGQVLPVSVGRARLEFGPMLSSNDLEYVAQNRRRSSRESYSKWLDEKRDSPPPRASLREGDSVFLDSLKDRRKMSLGAYFKWCAQKDATRLEEILEVKERRAREIEERERLFHEQLRKDAEMLEEVKGKLRNDSTKAFQEDLAQQGLSRFVSDKSTTEDVAMAVLDLHLAIEAVVGKTPSPTPRPMHPLPAATKSKQRHKPKTPR
jgi:hypothetical protein